MKAVIIKPYSSVLWMPPSYSLYGLIFMAMSLMMSGDELKKILQLFNDGNPPFLLSSSFPLVVKDNKKIFFLPFPNIYHFKWEKERKQNQNNQLSLGEYRKNKRFKKIIYISSENFFSISTGKKSLKDFFYSNEWEDFDASSLGIKQVNVFHNSINRMSNAVTKGLLYDTNEYFFKDGFYFLIKGDDTLINSALNFLSDFGIGGNNSIGKGQFSWSIVDASFIEVDNEGDYYVTLSSYMPNDDEISIYKNSENIYYTIEQVRGTLGTHFTGNQRVWKKKVITFLPGSSFPVINKNNLGCMVEVKDRTEGLSHPIYFVGYSLGVKIKF